MQRGEVWWASLAPPARRRPVLILTRDDVLPARNQVTVAIITTTVHGLDVEVPLNRRDGMSEPCVVNLDNIVTIPAGVLTERITKLSRSRMAQVREAVLFALDLK